MGDESKDDRTPAEKVGAPASPEGDPDAGNTDGERGVKPNSTTDGEAPREDGAND